MRRRGRGNLPQAERSLRGQGKSWQVRQLITEHSGRPCPVQNAKDPAKSSISISIPSLQKAVDLRLVGGRKVYSLERKCWTSLGLEFPASG